MEELKLLNYLVNSIWRVRYERSRILAKGYVRAEDCLAMISQTP